MKVSSIAAACLVLVWTATANAQESVEDLTKKGAVRMTAADVKAQIVGFQTEGPVLDKPASIQTRTLKSDGSFEARSMAQVADRVEPRWVNGRFAMTVRSVPKVHL